jgi:eukaryotic-like serine/threonine-protein kinase
LVYGWTSARWPDAFGERVGPASLCCGVVSGGERLPERIGPYAIHELLGAGGMGVVYRGVSEAGEQVAVKQIRGLRFSEEDRARFAAEIEALKLVFGPRVVSYVDGDPVADEPWLAVEYVPGATLREYVGDQGPLEPVLVAILGASLAEGLRTIHEAGLLHRDLKPHNIILAYGGPVVIDFGLALLTAAKVEAAESRGGITPAGSVVGTLLCMPPEQVRAGPLSRSADVYALGATLLYSAAGHYPFDAPSEYELMQRIDSPLVPPDLSGLPPVLVPTVAAMLAKDAAARPALGEVTTALVRVVTEAGFTALRARDLLRRVTAPNVARLPDPRPVEQPGDRPESWRRPRPAVRGVDIGDSSARARGAVHAAGKLRAAYARSGTL